jgi:2-polyprenyl-3-methyl-5-hydroxy-6-metoxy-1,4-benzoquinol methylase
MKESLRPVLATARRLQRSAKRIIYGDKYMEKTFTKFYSSNHWKDSESISGTGSNMDQTAEIRKQLPGLFKQLKVKTILDIPCGDYYWMHATPLKLDRYIGADIVTKIIDDNNKKYANKNTTFIKLDITNDKIPKVDLILCRDVLVHFSSADVFAALRNLKSSGSKYLLTTTFTDKKSNIKIETGGWRPINLEVAPFNFPKPDLVINEKTTQDKGVHADKSLGLWQLQNIKV